MRAENGTSDENIILCDEELEFIAIRLLTLQSGAATCSEGFVKCFLKVPLACLGSMAAA